MRRTGYQLRPRLKVNLVHRRFLCYPTATYRMHHLRLVDERAGFDEVLGPALLAEPQEREPSSSFVAKCR